MTKHIKQAVLTQIGTLCADIVVGDNGDNAKTAPVKLVARTSDPIWYEDLDGESGWLVHDFGSMSFTGRVALDYNHAKNVGYLNRAEVIDNTLHVSGAIVPFGQNAAAELLYQLREGVPYEASIEGWSKGFDRYDRGSDATLNGRTYDGFDPLYVQTDWQLAATAITDRGRDGNTSVALLSKNKDDAQKEIEVVITNKTDMGQKTMEIKEEAVVVEPAAEVAPDQAATVEAVDETQKDQAKTPVEDKPEVVDAEPAETEPVAEEVTKLSAAVPEADARQHAKNFITFFGKNDGVTYFADGLSINDAFVKHIEVLNARIADLESRSKTERPTQTAVKFSAVAEPVADDGKPKTFQDMFHERKGKKN